MGLVLGDSLLRNDKQLEDILDKKVSTDTVQDITATKRFITSSGGEYLQLKRDTYDGDWLLNIESPSDNSNHIKIRVIDGLSIINGSIDNNGFSLDGNGLYPTISSTYDLGSSSNRLRNIYVSNDININGTNILNKINTIENRTINNKPLTSNITLTASDVGALPTSTSYVSSINGVSGAITNVAKLSDIPTDYVNLDGAQIINGSKIFSTNIILNYQQQLVSKDSAGNIKPLIGLYDNNVIELGDSTTGRGLAISLTDIRPFGANKGLDLGSSSYPFDNAYIKGTLVLSKTTDSSGTSNNGPALIVGGTQTTAHIEIDSNEITAKSNGTTPATLGLNNEGGNIEFGINQSTSGGMRYTAGSDFSPKANNILSLGKSNQRWLTGFFNSINLNGGSITYNSSTDTFTI